MSVVRLCDNVGNTIPPGIESGHPVLASGITLTDSTADGGDHTETLVAGATYKLMANATGAFLFGIATTATAANILWFVPAGKTVCLTMPIGYTALHYQCLANGGKCYIVKLADGVPSGMTTT